MCHQDSESELRALDLKLRLLDAELKEQQARLAPWRFATLVIGCLAALLWALLLVIWAVR